MPVFCLLKVEGIELDGFVGPSESKYEYVSIEWRENPHSQIRRATDPSKASTQAITIFLYPLDSLI